MACALLGAVWALLAVAAAGTSRIPSLESVTVYGKAMRQLDAASKVHAVPKSWFAHFYWTGLLVNSFVLWCQWAGHPVLTSALPLMSCTPCFLANALFQLHLLRRAFECAWVHSYQADASMPAVVYLGGLAHYVLSPLSFVAPASGRSEASTEPLSSACCVGIALFVLGNVAQHVCHVHLARLRERGQVWGVPSDGRGHFLPLWGPFARLCCPHYTAEILIYVGLWLVCGAPSLTPLMLALWTASNLCVTGNRSLAWYVKTFGAHRTAHLRAVLPGVL